MRRMAAMAGPVPERGAEVGAVVVMFFWLLITETVFLRG
jgi:hypothetical protein